MALRLCPSLRHQFVPPFHSKTPVRTRKLFVRSCIVDPNESRKLLTDVKGKLERDHHNLPAGKNGRDDEAMILWYLKDRKFSVEEAVSKLVKAIKWRQEFGVSELSEESVRNVAETGKAYVHDFLDVYDRPVLIVVASKHFPGKHNPYENEKLCVFSIENALSRLPPGKEEILVILDLRGFGTENADLRFTTFLFDVFYCYYPKRLGQVLFVEAPFVFKPVWQIAKPLLKSYASLLYVAVIGKEHVIGSQLTKFITSRTKVRFCTVEDVKSEYFTESTLPTIFRH